ncbi:Rhodanese-like protein [Pholiota conissans]|uniref:Rhodanese-like protein n=1 Tax=Pholiota conissans TaxID=109636 RepID=A0A9P5Z4D5_9AGAR|nr:Rhodanese-like protein [Pholiota conissans]
MFRGTFIRTAKTATRSFAVRPAIVSLKAVRLNSTQTPSAKPQKTPEELARKAALEKQDNLQRDWDAKVIPYEEFLVKTQNPSPDTYIIDVREPDEVIQGMIPSAVNIPLTVLANALHMDRKQFAEKFGFEKPRTSQEVVFYCRSGKRSTSASDVAKRNGYTNILNYKGSWLEWTAKENEKAASK